MSPRSFSPRGETFRLLMQEKKRVRAATTHERPECRDGTGTIRGRRQRASDSTRATRWRRRRADEDSA
ncbi:hypothetical protein BHE74_00017660, partial [Ensete ventricosum]